MCSLVPLQKAAYVWYRTMTAILLRIGSGGVTTQRCMQFSLLRPPPPLQSEVTFQKGGRNDARVRYTATACRSKEFSSSHNSASLISVREFVGGGRGLTARRKRNSSLLATRQALSCKL